MNKPAYRYIKRNEKNESPSQIIAVDCCAVQASDENGKRIPSSPWIPLSIAAVAARRKGNAWYAETEESFSFPEELWEWIRKRSRPKEPVWIYGYNWHFLAQACGLWEELDAERFALSLPERERVNEEGKTVPVKAWPGMLAVDTSPFIVFLISRSGVAKVVDVRNYFDAPISELGKSVGLSVPELADGDACETEPREVALQRARVSAVIMRRTMDSWRQGERGNWQPTAARLAMGNWRHEFMPECGVLSGDPAIDRKFERQGFYGGTVKHWFRGYYGHPVYKVDACGLYPSRMLSGLFPVRVGFDTGVGSVLGSTQPVRPEECMADIEVLGQGDLPLRRVDGSLDYPDREFRTVLCGDELADCVASGRVIKWYRWISYKTADVFSRYVAYWWAIRIQAKAMHDLATDQLAKLMLNSLYGKFASRSPKWETMPGVMPLVRWGHFVMFCPELERFRKYRGIAGMTQRLTKQEEKDDTFPAISAFVTSAGRTYMKRIRDMLGHRNVLMQQTDAFVLTQEGYDRLCASEFWGPTDLGKFRLVDRYDWIDVRDALHYRASDDECLSGVPADRVQVGDWSWQTVRSMTTEGVIAAKGPTGDVPAIVSEYSCGLTRDPRAFGDDGWVLQNDTRLVMSNNG